MSGRILLLPITGSGRANLTLVNTKIEHRLIGEPYEQDGVKYMKLKDYKVAFDPKKVHIHFENLFNDKLLSETMNRFLNENWEIAFNELKSGYSKSFGKIFKEISNRIFTKVPFDQIFLSPGEEWSNLYLYYKLLWKHEVGIMGARQLFLLFYLLFKVFFTDSNKVWNQGFVSLVNYICKFVMVIYMKSMVKWCLSV